MPKEPGEPKMGELAEAEKEPEPNEISFYATEWLETTKDTVSKQGFGTTKKLKSPIKHIHYSREGMLYFPEAQRKRMEQEGVVSSRGGRKDIKLLAENFSGDYLSHQNPELQKRGKSSYSLRFEPTQSAIQDLKSAYYGENQKVRGLTEEEQKEFLKVFTEANTKATNKEKNVKK